MLKKLWSFFRDYKEFGIVLVAAIVALLIDIAGKDSSAHIILAVVSLSMTIPLVIDMVRTFRDGSYGIDVLAITAIITSVVLGEYWAGMIIVLMLTGGEALEDYAENRAKRELTDLLKRAPQKATLLKNGKEFIISVAEIKVGDLLLVKPGDVVPADGIVTKGESSFDESSITGESLPVPKQLKDTVVSGSVNGDGAVVIEAIHTSKDSQYEQIITLVQNAADSQAPFVRLTDRYSVPFTVVSFIIAGTMWAVTGDPMRFLQILVVATPCPLLLAAPIALISGMSRSARHGIIVKSGSVLEKLAETKAIGFDKTGTLTKGQPVVSRILPTGKMKIEEILAFAAGMEKQSSHVLAKAIVAKADEDSIESKKISQQKEKPGFGIQAKYQGKTLHIGNARYVKELAVTLPKDVSLDTISATASYFIVDGHLQAIIEFEDAVREESQQTIESMKNLGIKETMMVSGDKESVAIHIASLTGVDSYKADCLPGDKIIAIEQLRSRHSPVAFVGDGVNDAPVLTAADVGIALGAKGSTAASQAADIVIMLDDVSKVAQAKEISTRTFKIARQSILLGIGMSFGLMAMFSTGKFSPTLGAALQELVDVAVIINALRAHTGNFKFAPFKKTS
jgi:heavy metal translocating P-type ATPase